MSTSTSFSDISGGCEGLFNVKARVRLCTLQLCRDYDDSINQSPLGGVEAVGPLAPSCEICLGLSLVDAKSPPGPLSVINAFLYDEWAAKCSFICPHDEVCINAGASAVVRDPGAQPGEHQWCIAIASNDKESTSIEVSPFDSPSPDAKFTVDGMSIDAFEPPARGSAFMFYSKAGNGRGSGMDSHSDALTLELHRSIERHLPCGMKDKQYQSNVDLEQAPSPLDMWKERGSQSRILVSPPKKRRSQKLTKKQNTGAPFTPLEHSYVYTKLSEVTGEMQACYLCVYGVITAFTHPLKTKGPDHFVSLSIVDESLPDPCKALSCNLFHRDISGLPTPLGVGVVIRLHRVKVQQHDSRPQLVGNVSSRTSWVLMTSLRLLSAIRQPLQHQSSRSASPDSTDTDDGPFESYNRTTNVFPSYEWKISSASKTLTLTPEDGDRVRRLVNWRESWASTWKLCVNASGGAPNSTPVCALIGGRENRNSTKNGITDFMGCILKVDRDSDNIVERVHLWDGTGTSSSPSCGSQDVICEKVIQIVGRVPLVFTEDLTRRLDHVSSVKEFPGATVCVNVQAHGNALSSLHLCEGMWVRLRKMDIQKLNGPRDELMEILLGANGSVNPLPPDMLEVNELLLSYQKSLLAIATPNSSNVESTGSNTTARPIVSRCTVSSLGYSLRSISEGLALHPPCTFYSNVRIRGTMPVNPCLFVQETEDQGGVKEFLFTLVLHDDTADIQTLVLDTQRGVLSPQVEPSQFNSIPAAEYIRTIRNFQETSILFEVKISTLYIPNSENGEVLIYAVLEDSKFAP